MLKLVGVVSIIGLALLGTAIFLAVRRGWMRNGYFTISATVLIVIAIFLFFQTIGGVLTLLSVGLHVQQAGVQVLALNGIAQLLVMLGGTVLLSRSVGQDPFAVFRLEGFSETPVWCYVLAIPIMMTAQMVGVAAASLWTEIFKLFPSLYSHLNTFESLGDQQLEGLVTAHNTLEFVLILIFVAVIPALAEETLFRGFAQSNIERSGKAGPRPIVALLVASVLFAAIHLSVFKFPGLLALGLALGWMSYRTNNLFVGSLGHAANNGLIIIGLYLSEGGANSNAASSALVGSGEMTPSQAILLLVTSLPFLILFLYLFNRVTAPLTARENARIEYEETHSHPLDDDDRYPNDLIQRTNDTRHNLH